VSAANRAAFGEAIAMFASRRIQKLLGQRLGWYQANKPFKRSKPLKCR
jgi:hypothetical protein